MISSIRNEKTTLGIHFQCMRGTEVTNLRANLAPLFDERSVSGKLHNPPSCTFRDCRIIRGQHGLATMPICYKDAPVGGGDNIVGLIEVLGVVPRLTAST